MKVLEAEVGKVNKDANKDMILPFSLFIFNVFVFVYLEVLQNKHLYFLVLRWKIN